MVNQLILEILKKKIADGEVLIEDIKLQEYKDALES